MKKEKDKEVVSYGELILEFIKSLPQVEAKFWIYEGLELYFEYGRWRIDYNVFGDKWTEVIFGDVVEHRLYDNTDLNSNLREIYTIIEANKKDIIKTFTVDNSAKVAQLKQQIEQLNKQLEELDNGN